MKWSVLTVAAASCIGDARAAWFRMPWDTQVGHSHSLPRETGRINPSSATGWTPRPTQGPGYKDEAEVVLELLRRDNTWLNSKTCGYFAGTSSAPYVCDGSSTCKTNQQNAVACVSGTDQPFFTQCFDFKAVQGGACSNAGALTGCCFSSDSPACQTFIWEGSPAKSMFACGDAPELISLLNEPQFVHDATKSSTVTTTQTSTTSSSSATNTANTGSKSSGPSTGAIAGGVVGGVAVLGIAGAAMWFFTRRNKRKGATSQPYNAVPSGDAGYPYGGASGQVPLGSPPASYSAGQSPYSAATGTAYDPRQSYYDPGKPPLGSPGQHPYYAQPQSPPPPQQMYNPYPQPPMELDGGGVPKGNAINPAEMAAETPR